MISCPSQLHEEMQSRYGDMRNVCAAAGFWDGMLLDVPAELILQFMIWSVCVRI